MLIPQKWPVVHAGYVEGARTTSQPFGLPLAFKFVQQDDEIY